MSAHIDPNKILVDPSVPDLWIQDTVDLSAPVQTPSTPGQVLDQGKYVVSKRNSGDDCWIITAVTPFAWARYNVGQSSEGVTRISSDNGDGFFLFQPQVAGKDALGLSLINLAGWTTAAGATSAEPKTASGLAFISDAPFDQTARAAGNNLNRFLVGPGQELKVLFSLIPLPSVNPLPSSYVIGGILPVASPLLRVDYAGVIMVGKKCPKQYYDGLKNAMNPVLR